MIVIDSSVVLKWVIFETGSDDALGLIGRALVAPDILQAEVGGVLAKKVRRRELSSAQATAKWVEAMRYVGLLPGPSFAARALDLSLSLHHAMMDCYFLAAAEDRAIPFVTADNRFALKLRATSFAPLVVLLGDEVPLG